MRIFLTVSTRSTWLSGCNQQGRSIATPLPYDWHLRLGLQVEQPSTIGGGDEPIADQHAANPAEEVAVQPDKPTGIVVQKWWRRNVLSSGGSGRWRESCDCREGIGKPTFLPIK
jgi:hypothetical protein